jgi:hypothetical protein
MFRPKPLQRIEYEVLPFGPINCTGLIEVAQPDKITATISMAYFTLIPCLIALRHIAVLLTCLAIRVLSGVAIALSSYTI